MIFAEPPTTKLDLRFRIARIPVRIHPFFWVTTIGVAFRSRPTAAGLAMWVVAVVVSILVHEMGHALAFRRFGFEPRITLYGFGGLASAERRSPPTGRRQIIISAAGPLAGFALAALVVGGLFVFGFHSPLFRWSVGRGAPIANDLVATFIADLMFINLLWGGVNLLPVHPLDGGQIALEIARGRDPLRGVQRSLWLSLLTAIATALVSLIVFHDAFVTILFAYLAYLSWQVLQQHQVGFESLSLVRWVRARRQSWRKARHTRAVDRDLASDLRRLEKLDDLEPTPEVKELLKKVQQAKKR